MSENLTQDYFLQPEDIEYLRKSINRLLGVINSSKNDIEENHACIETLSKLLAAQKALASVAKEMVKRGVVKCLNQYSTQEELIEAIETLFKF